jgi:hypothetical protein
MMPISFPETLLPIDDSHPYYIVVPPYVRTSAGVSALHVLCHWLNMSGHNAFLYLIPKSEGLGVNPRLQTPILDADIVAHHFKAGLTPVVVYPEVIPGNPFGATVRARWIGNYPGLLGGADIFDDDEICFAHSAHLARALPVSANLLCIPVVDSLTFRPAAAVRREGTCFYASKFQTVHGQAVFGLPPNSREITRSAPATRAELAALLQQSELFYCFEDSALINEAAMCGCPVVMMKNDFFTWPLGVEEVGWDGYAWGDDPAEIARAKATVVKAYDNYIRNIPRFFSQLHTFVLLTQTRARVTPYLRQVVLPGEDAVADDGCRLRRALADALLEVSSLKAAPGGADILWTPDFTISGARSPVTLVTGWDTVDDRGAVAQNACGFTVCPDDATTIELTLALTPGRDLHVALPVLEPGRPVFITIAPADRLYPSTLLLKSIKSVKRDGGSAQSLNVEAPAHSPGITTAATHFALDQTAEKRLHAFNCKLDYVGTTIIVDAFGPDPHILVDIDYKDLDGAASPTFLWGAYEAEGDESLQVYMPAGPSGAFEESVSCKVKLERGKHVFVTRLPRAEGVGAVRIDPLDRTGRLSFAFLHLVFFRAMEARPTKKRTVPVAPQLDRFERQSLIDGTAFPLTDKCIAGYAHNAFEIRTNESDASVIFYLAKPIYCAEERTITIHLDYESTLSARIAIRFPDAHGNYGFDGLAKAAVINKGHHSLEVQASLSGPLQSLQLVLHGADILRVLKLDLLRVEAVLP